jgi:hypothetical protein
MQIKRNYGVSTLNKFRALLQNNYKGNNRQNCGMSLHQYDCSAQLTADRLNTGKLMRGFSAGVRVNYIDRVNYDFPTGNTTTFLIWFNIQKKAMGNHGRL